MKGLPVIETSVRGLQEESSGKAMLWGEEPGSSTACSQESDRWLSTI